MKKLLLITIILLLQSVPSYGITVRELGNTVVSTIQTVISSTFLFFWEIYDKVQNGNILDLQISQFIFLFILLMIPIGFIGGIFNFIGVIIEDYCERKNYDYEKVKFRIIFLSWLIPTVVLSTISFYTN